jgi:hypothetical protein
MSSTQRKKPSTNRSGSRRTKRKLAKAASTTKALVHKAEHVRKQTIKPNASARAPTEAPGAQNESRTSGAGDIRAIGDTEVRRTAATTENLQPAIAGPTQILAFWSPMALLLRQQTLLSSMALHVIQSQRLWAQALMRSA